MNPELKNAGGRSDPSKGLYLSAVEHCLIGSDGKRLLIDGDTELPELCIKCGVELSGGKRCKKTLYWVHPLLWLTLLAGLLPAALIILVLRKQVRLEFSLCDRHFRRRIAMVFTVVASLAAAVVLFAAAIAIGQSSAELAGLFAILGIFSLLAFLVLLVIAGNHVQVTGFKKGVFRLKGVGPWFLAMVEDEAARRAEKQGEPGYVE